jgi:hypothetical protein
MPLPPPCSGRRTALASWKPPVAEAAGHQGKARHQRCWIKLSVCYYGISGIIGLNFRNYWFACLRIIGISGIIGH